MHIVQNYSKCYFDMVFLMSQIQALRCAALTGTVRHFSHTRAYAFLLRLVALEVTDLLLAPVS